jgi:hypothetical protein
MVEMKNMIIAKKLSQMITVGTNKLAEAIQTITISRNTIKGG